MAASGSARRPDVTDDQRRWWIARTLLSGAILIALYLASTSLSGRALPGCRPEEGCGDLLASRWAYWLGVPVSVPAIAIYAALGAVTFVVQRKKPPLVRRRLCIAALALSSLIAAAALWFAGLQLFVAERWCQWCVATHLLAVAAAAIVIYQVRRMSRQRRRAPVLSPRQFETGMAAAAALGWAVLLGGQLASAAPAASTSMVSSSAEPGPDASALARLAGGAFVLHGGRFKLNATELPVLGSADAATFIVSLFDLTCHHCRDTHRLIAKALERYSGRLAIISLPMPLDSACNPLVKRTTAEHAHACEFARLGLAVFRAQSAAFREFDDGLFAAEVPPPIEQARARAAQLVGAAQLEQALSDPWVDEQLASAVALYEANAHAAGGDTRMPQIVIGAHVVHGPIGTADELFQLLERHTALGAPSRAK